MNNVVATAATVLISVSNGGHTFFALAQIGAPPPLVETN